MDAISGQRPAQDLPQVNKLFVNPNPNPRFSTVKKFKDQEYIFREFLAFG